MWWWVLLVVAIIVLVILAHFLVIGAQKGWAAADAWLSKIWNSGVNALRGDVAKLQGVVSSHEQKLAAQQSDLDKIKAKVGA